MRTISKAVCCFLTLALLLLSTLTFSNEAVSAETGNIASARKGNVFKHPIGFSFWYPEQWSAVDRYEFLELLPPDPGQSPQGKTEFYLLLGEPVAMEGITRPDDPRIAQYLDMQVAGISNMVRRTGQPRPVKFSMGTGSIYEWIGQTPTGEHLQVRSYTGVINGYGIALISFGLKEHIDSREEDLKSIFNSFGFGQGQKDPRLIGNWNLVSSDSVTSWENKSPFESDYTRAKMTSGSDTSLSFHRDGSWQWKSITSIYLQSGEESSGGEEMGQVFLSGDSEKVERGNWNASNGILFRIWEDGSWEEYKYRISQSANGTVLQMASNKYRIVWQKSN